MAAAGCRQLLVLGPGDRYAFERAYATRLGVDVAGGGRGARSVTAVLAEAHAGRTRWRSVARRDAPALGLSGALITRSAVGATAPRPRALLAAALGAGCERRLFRRDERAHPCGAAGGLDLTQPALAAGLADARLADAARRRRRGAGHRGPGLPAATCGAGRRTASKSSGCSNCSPIV